MIIGKQPVGKSFRVSSDLVWPLRRADGRTWAQSKRDREQGREKRS